MSRQWKSGDVALVRTGLGFDAVGLRSGIPSNMGWAYTSADLGGGPNKYGNCWMSDPEAAAVIRPLVLIDPETILPGWTAYTLPSLLEASAEIVAESAAPREVHETTLLLNLAKAFDAVLETPLIPSEPTDVRARVTDRRENIWRLLADGEWVCTSGPDSGEYLTWSGLTERGPLEVDVP